MANAIAYEAIAVSSAAAGIGPTATTATNRVRSATFTCDSTPVVYRNDGTAPAANQSGGTYLWPGQTVVVVGERAVLRMLFIRLLGLDATVQAVYYSDVLDAGSISGSLIYRDDTNFIIGGGVSPIGALADETSPDSVDEGDIGLIAMTVARELYATPRSRGASEVIQARQDTSTSTSRITIGTPSSGLKIRVLSVQFVNQAAAGQTYEVYFGTGVSLDTTAGKEVFDGLSTGPDAIGYSPSYIWPDGAGPVGAADDVLSIKASAASNWRCVVTYREEP